MRTKYIEELPRCDFCGESARYDAPVVGGHWAYMCEKCAATKRMPLDIGTEFTTEKTKPRTEEPTIEDLIEWSENGIARATDGCEVEPDGVCQHGCRSWLLVMGLV